jgi:hypothetical protein
LVAVAPSLGATFDGVYSGKRVLIEGSDPACPSEDDVLVTIHGDMVTFTNSALQNFLITFSPHPDGSFSQIYIDAGGDTVSMQGRITGDILDADVSNPPCEHHWHLKKR